MLWGGWGERKRERALSIFSIIDILMGIPSGSLCGGESASTALRCTLSAGRDKEGELATTPLEFEYLYSKKADAKC